MRKTLDLHLLGVPRFLLDREPVENFVSTKAQALLSYLAVTGIPHPRPHLAGLLWGEKTEEAARVNLRQVLSNLRRLVGDHLIITRQEIAFDRRSAYFLDVETFERLLTAPSPSPDELRHALSLYRGEFLKELYVRGAPDFEAWVLLKRARLQTLAVEALQKLIVHHRQRGEYHAAIRYAQQLLTITPWQEEGHRQLMWLLAHTGQHEAALAQYERCRHLLATELGVEPSSRTRALYERIRAARRLSHPPLPPQPTPFIGRERELRQIARLLANPDCRLLTLVGPGGIGKTRLALQVAAQHRDAFLHGVGFVPLASLQSPALLPQAIAKALGFTFHGQADLETQLLNHLREREMLLVLDNFEHLLTGTEFLVTLLQQAPDVKLLVTSREALHLRWEWRFEVHGMTVPEPTGADSIEGYDAARLFLHLARRLDPDFSLEKEQEAVASICRLVEGMPLGIELAAAWVREFPCATIAQRIERNLSFLTTPLRDVPARHRSLLAAFDYSWASLSAEERRAFRRVAVFQGGFRPEAARWVAGIKQSLLQALVSKSLLRQESSGRYTMHRLLQQYALEKLRQVPEEEAQMRERHSLYYADFLHRMEASVDGARQKETLEHLDEEMENLWAAWEWAVSRGEVEVIEKALETLYRFYEMRGWFREGAALFASAAERLRRVRGGEGEIVATLARLRARQGVMALHYGDSVQAQAQLEASLAIFRQRGDRGEVAFVLNNLGILASYKGEYEEAERRFQESLALYRALGKRARIATVLNNLGIHHRIVGNYDQARQLAQESLALCREIGYHRGMARAIQNLGDIAQCVQHDAEAKPLYQESVALFREIEDRWGIALSLGNLGHTTYRLGEYAEAKAHLQESLALRREIGDRQGIVIALNNLASVARAMGEAQEARQYLREALERAMEIEATPLALDALLELALLLAEKDEEAAATALEIATFVHHHPATEAHTRVRAEALASELAARLPADLATRARERGRSRSLEAMVVWSSPKLRPLPPQAVSRIARRAFPSGPR